MTTKVSSAMQDLTDDYAFSGTVSGVVGTIVQVVNVMDRTVGSTTTAMPFDDTIPQNTEGDELMTLAITPTNVSNILRIDVSTFSGHSALNNGQGWALFQDSTAGALASRHAITDSGAAGDSQHVSFTHWMSAGTVSATTFKVRGGGQSGTFYFNSYAATRIHGGTDGSSITITEIAV
tara:strand:+ start:1010 stop:1543 length:534 start_codon:yes stop_codon:yes gene_type:complete